MSKEMKTISFTSPRSARVLHIEAPGCIINIRKGLTDSEGRDITSVQILCDQYADSPKAAIPDLCDLRDAATILARLPEPLEPMSIDEMEEFLRSKLNPITSYNVRVVMEKQEVPA